MRTTPALALALLLASVGCTPSEPAPCDPWFADPAVDSLQTALDAMAATAPAWDDYTIAHHPVVLTGSAPDTTGGCALIWRAQEAPQRLVLAAPQPMATGLYGFWNGDSVGPNAPRMWARLAETMQAVAPEIEAALRAEGETRTLLLGVPLDYAGLGAIGERLAALGRNPTLTLALMAVHESYHLHSQFPTLFDQEARYAWPAWVRMVDRNTLTQQCYESGGGVAAAFAQEQQHLIAAWEHFYPAASRDLAAAREDAQHYIDTREARYSLIPEAVVPAAGGAIPCREAEAIMELLEGAATWVSHAAAFEGGVMSVAEARAAYDDPINAAFYPSGSFQLWTLDALLGRDRLRTVTRTITTSGTATTSIFAAFTEAWQAADESSHP